MYIKGLNRALTDAEAQQQANESNEKQNNKLFLHSNIYEKRVMKVSRRTAWIFGKD